MKIHATIELTAAERLALEKQLGGGLLAQDAGDRWAETILRDVLGDLVRRHVRPFVPVREYVNVARLRQGDTFELQDEGRA